MFSISARSALKVVVFYPQKGSGGFIHKVSARFELSREQFEAVGPLRLLFTSYWTKIFYVLLDVLTAYVASLTPLA